MPPQAEIVESLRGGLNTTDPPNALQPDECTVAENVEWFLSTLGERRLGGVAVDLAGSTISSSDTVVFATRHFPTANEVDNELWIVTAVVGTSVTIHRRTSLGIWSVVSQPVAFDPSALYVYQIQAASFKGKLYFCARLTGAVDRMFLWDGTSLRYVGLSQPGVPTVTNEGAGTFSVIRYYRVRYQQKSGSTVIRQSEPSDSVTFTPSGTGAGAHITKPAAINEGETHWVVEASYDNANFYQIATIVVATTTYNDETPSTVSYADEGDLSPNIGEYVPFPSARLICIDDDRVVLGGSFVDDSLNSHVEWTPVQNDPGVSNSERIPADTDNSMDLDANEGGGLTGMSQASNGAWYAFKFSHIYSMTRTGNAANAYAPITLSKSRGALFGSVVSGMDEYGRPCVYFADPLVGPSRVSPEGIQQIKGIRGTWARVNTSATTVVIRGVYYPFKQQMWWMVAADGANTPTLGLKLQVNELRAEQGGVRRGWSLFTEDLPKALTATLLTEILTNSDGTVTLSTRPILGYAAGVVLRADQGDTDNGRAYHAKMRTRPMFKAGLLNQWGARIGALLAGADPSAQVRVAFVRDYGLETNSVITTLEPQGTEDFVIRIFDNLVMSEATALQLEFSDITDLRQQVGDVYHAE